MKIEPIITDPTDCDVYKWSMGNFLYKQGYLREVVGWQFFNRGGTKFPVGYAKALQEQVDSWADLSFTDEQLAHLQKTMYWLDHFFIWAYLKTFRFDTASIKISSVNRGSYEDVSISYEGEWGQVIFFEIYLLSTMSELYNIMSGMDKKIISEKEFEERTLKKLRGIEECGAKVAEFGTRRRYSRKIHTKAVELILEHTPNILLGTSNEMLSRKYNLVPIGTMGHELIMFMGAKYNPTMANEIVMRKWVEVYHGALGICLPDTYTTKIFLNSFDLLNSKLWDGVREDSAPDTDAYVDMFIEHYKKMRIDPSTKTITHSNGIDSVERIVHMQKYRENEIRRTFGIGTWLTNDVYPEGSGLKPVDWVIKMTHTYINNHKKYCVKLSDTEGKVTSVNDEATKQYMKELFLI